MSKHKINKVSGITLIALVVTIIVLLILAGITVQMLSGENGILKRSEKAKEKTEDAGAKEQIQLQVLGSFNKDAKLTIKVLKTNLESIGAKVIADDFPITAILNHKSYKIDANGNIEMQENADRAGIKVGDYINFEPNTDYDEEGNPIAKTYSKEYLAEKYTGNNQSQYNNEDLIQNTLKWQVLKIYEDGSLKLIGSSTNNRFQSKGTIGYNNFVWILNDICEQLYSKKDVGITARNVNIEDFEDNDFYIDENKGNWRFEKDKYISTQLANRELELNMGSNYIDAVNRVNNSVTYKKEYSFYPYIYQYENGSGIDTKSIKTNGITQSDRFMTNREQLYEQEKDNLRKQANSGLTTQYTNYIIDINEYNYGEAYNVLKSESGYTLASRFVDCRSQNAVFGVSFILGEQRYFIARDSSSLRRWKWQ